MLTHERFILSFYQATFQTLPTGLTINSSALVAWCIFDFFGVMPWNYTYNTKDGDQGRVFLTDSKARN